MLLCQVQQLVLKDTLTNRRLFFLSGGTNYLLSHNNLTTFLLQVGGNNLVCR